jgi:hypothetical protein
MKVKMYIFATKTKIKQWGESKHMFCSVADITDRTQFSVT